MRLGILGGTFDPVHVVHVFIGASARHQLKLDTVLYPVANAPWQKSGRAMTPARDRYDMVAAALDGVDGLEPSPMEIERGGTTFTADTVAALCREHPGAELFLIVGSDVADDLHTWERVDELRPEVTLVVAQRPGAAAPRTLGDWRVEMLDSPLLDLSSSYLRERLHEGRPVDGLVPPAVVRLIGQRALYALTG